MLRVHGTFSPDGIIEIESDRMTNTPCWDNLRIRGFRGLKDLTLDDLGAFNILVGANDVGKTSILESIFLLSGFANLLLPVKVQNFRSFLVNDISDLSSLFHRLTVDDPMELVATSSHPLERRTLTISAPYESRAAVDATSKRGGNGAGVRSSSSIPLRSRALRYDATVQRGEDSEITSSGALVVKEDTFDSTITPESAVDDIIPARFITVGVQYDSDIIADVIVNKKSDALVRYLKIINPRVEAIAADAKSVYLDIGLKQMLPLNMFGSGMVRAAYIISLCITGGQRILLVDEIENGLHHKAIGSLLAVLLRLSREQSIQIFATTHSWGLLDELGQTLHKDELAEYRATTNCYALQKDSAGLVRSYRYSYKQYSHALKHGIEVR